MPSSIGPGPGAYESQTSFGHGPSTTVRGRLGVFDSKSSVLNTMQSEFLRGIYKKEEEYYGKGDSAGNVLFQTAARSIIPRKQTIEELLEKYPEKKDVTVSDRLTSNLHSNVIGNPLAGKGTRYMSTTKRAMHEAMSEDLSELSSVPSEFRRHRDDFTDYVHATLRKRELDKTVDAFLKDRQKRPGGGPHRG